MPAVEIADPSGERVGIDVIERSERYEAERTAARSMLAAPYGADAAGLAELEMQIGAGAARRNPCIFDLRLGALQQPVALGTDEREP